MSHLHVNKDTSGHNTDGITLGKVEANGWIDTNEEMGRLSWAASYGSSFTPAIGAYISAKADANWNGNEAPTRLGFFTAPENSLTPVERLRIDKDGKVGIGDQNPQDYLEINGSGKGLGGLTISNSTHNHAALSFARSSSATARIYASEPNATHTGQLNFQTSDASGSSPNLVTAMVIADDQNVGIGNTNPAATLEVGTLTSGSTGNVIINSEG